MTRPVIQTPRGKLIITTTGKSRLYLKAELRKEFRPRWQGRFDTAQLFLDSEVVRGCEPYMPLLTGFLVKSGILGTTPGSGEVAWIAPYAAAQYYSPRLPGSQTGPLRGPQWFERWKEADAGKTIKKAEGIAGGRISVPLTVKNE